MINKRKYIAFVRNQDQGETVKRLKVKYKNETSLYKYLLITTTCELLSVSLTIINFILSANGQIIQFGCSEYYAVLYVYVKYVLELLTILMIESALEALNLTTIFAKGIYIYTNTEPFTQIQLQLKKKKKRFLVRFLVIVCLAVSGVGVGIGFILVEIFLIAQLKQYYTLSTELLRSLQIHYQDTKYEFGTSSVEATSVLRYKRHYKWFTTWCLLLALNAIVCVTVFLLSLPQKIIGEDCIVELITKQEQTWINSIFSNDPHIKFPDMKQPIDIAWSNFSWYFSILSSLKSHRMKSEYTSFFFASSNIPGLISNAVIFV